MINNILISRETRKVLSKDNRFIGIEGENLQEVLVFNLDEQIEGNAIIEILFPDESTAYIEIEKTERGYELPVKSSLLTQNGIVKMQLRIIQAGQEIFKSELIRFKVKESINATETIPEQYPTWIDNLEALKLELQKAESERVEAEKQRAKAFTQMQEDTQKAIDDIKKSQEEYDANALQKTVEFNSNVDNQTEAFDEHVKNKTTEYDAHTEKLTNRIIDMEEKDINQDKLIENLQNQIIELETENETLKNQFPTGQAEGENITLNDSSDMEFKELRIGGNSWQETRSGINKFDISKAKRTSGVCSLQNNGDSIDVIATNTSQYISANIDITDLFKEGETIYATADFVASGSNTGAYRIQWAEDTGSTKGNLILMSSTSGSVKSGTIPTKPEGATKLFLYLYGNVEGTVASGDTVTYSKIMLSNQPITEYEQFGQMPSPEFRSEIRNVNGSANITVCNENLFDEITELGTINATTGENISYSEGIRGKNYCKCKPNTTYYVYCGTTVNSLGLVFYDSNKTFIATKYGVNTTITTPANAKYFRIRLDGYGTTYNNDILVAEGSEPKEYIPHQSQQFTFPLAEEQRMYKDSYLADDGVHHKRTQKVFDGTENWNRSGYTTNTSFVAWVDLFNVKGGESEGLLNIGPVGYINEMNYRSFGAFYNVSGTAIFLKVENKDISNWNDSLTDTEKLELFKSYLAEQYANGTPIIFEYLLAKEVIQPYTEEQQKVYNEINKAHSYKNVTHIFSTDETSPVFEVTYRKDLETMFNNINNAILGGN